MLKYIKFSPYLSSFAHYTSTIPQKWVNDIKYVEFDELLSSSVGALALVFRWKNSEKNEFTEILYRNFDGSDITAIGINEVQLPGGQWGTDITADLDNCWVFFAVVEVKK